MFVFGFCELISGWKLFSRLAPPSLRRIHIRTISPPHNSRPEVGKYSSEKTSHFLASSLLQYSTISIPSLFHRTSEMALTGPFPHLTFCGSLNQKTHHNPEFFQRLELAEAHEERKLLPDDGYPRLFTTCNKDFGFFGVLGRMRDERVILEGG